MYRVLHFSGDQRGLLAECQALRYRVYHHDLGLDTPDLDHGAKLDIEERDEVCDFAAVRGEDGAIVGCIRMQPEGRTSFYAELEFDLLGDTWTQARHVEGARFAVTAEERGGPVPLFLFQAFRRYCRRAGATRILSVAIIRGDEGDRAKLAQLTKLLYARTNIDLGRGRPARGYEIDPPTIAELETAPALDIETVSPMLRLLATRRTTLSSQPAYCRRFGTFNFLLSTRLGA